MYSSSFAIKGTVVSALTGEILENVNGIEKYEPIEILQNTAAAGPIVWGTHFGVSSAEYYFKIGLTECESNWVESILSGAVNAFYYNYNKKVNLN